MTIADFFFDIVRRFRIFRCFPQKRYGVRSFGKAFWVVRGGPGGHLGASRGLRGASLGRLGSLLGASWGVLGRSWGVLGGPGGALGASWGALGAIFFEVQFLIVFWIDFGTEKGAQREAFGEPKQSKNR